jgi:hypothetical protein
MADAAHARYLECLTLDAAAAQVDAFLRPLVPADPERRAASPATL